jgi:hypothetical protein
MPTRGQGTRCSPVAAADPPVADNPNPTTLRHKIARKSCARSRIGVNSTSRAPPGMSIPVPTAESRPTAIMKGQQATLSRRMRMVVDPHPAAIYDYVLIFLASMSRLRECMQIRRPWYSAQARHMFARNRCNSLGLRGRRGSPLRAESKRQHQDATEAMNLCASQASFACSMSNGQSGHVGCTTYT